MSTITSQKDIFHPDIMKRVMIYATHSVSELNNYRIICQHFKSIADDLQLLHTLLEKKKGPHFSDRIYSNDPKKFLIVDRKLTRVFKALITKVPIQDEKKGKFLKSISSIALFNLQFGVFLIRTPTLEPKWQFFKFTKQHMDNFHELETHVLDEKRQKKWENCLSTLANYVADHDYNYIQKEYMDTDDPIVARIREIGDLPSKIKIFQQIKASFDCPNDKMKHLIQKYVIKDIFFADPLILVFNSQKALHPIIFESAIRNTEESDPSFISNTILDILESTTITKKANGGISFKLEPTKKAMIKDMFSDNSLNLKARIDQSSPGNNVKLMLAHLFPTIWPNSLNLMSLESQRSETYQWIVGHYVSCLVDSMLNQARSEYYEYLKNIMRDLLKNPSSLFLEYMRNLLKRDLLQAFVLDFIDVLPPEQLSQFKPSERV